MNQKIKEILNESFYQLLIVYTLIVFFISLSLIYRYTLHFEILALILAVFGIIILKKSDEKSFLLTRNLHYILISVSVIFIILFRTVPYIHNSIPLGYDAGIYKYGIEKGLVNLDKWVVEGAFEPAFLYLMKPLSMIFSTDFILTYLLIAVSVLLGVSVYLLTEEFFGKNTAIIALLIFSLSVIQFKTFSYMYYKNILALSIMLFSLLFLAKYERNKQGFFLLFFIVFAGILGGIHRPTFYIFGLSYLIYAFISPLKNRRYDLRKMFFNIFIGVIILVLALSFYLWKFTPAITNMIEPTLEGFANPGESSGTFISFFSYQFLILAYLPFAIIGVFFSLRKERFNILLIWLLINTVIVYFQFFFFKRFIIPLDIILIIFASFGFTVLISNRKKLGIIVLLTMLLSAGIILAKESVSSKPLIGNNELNAILYLNNTLPDSYVMTTSSSYSPWVLGYSNRKTIAPGLFDYNKNNQEEWISFWSSQNLEEIKGFMNNYEKPLFVFMGEKQKDNLQLYPECFSLFYSQGNNKIYEYTC